mmetsp:Transcript_162423/g.311820  ORF Transcript_162423/g.311820 Transcript_162423/m.311820 type:complete len:485 (+) Transcript_162423:99-1553(+)
MSNQGLLQGLLQGEGKPRWSVTSSTASTRPSVTSSRPSVASSRPSVASSRPSVSEQKEANARVSIASAEVYANLPEFSCSQEVIDHIMSVEPGEEVDIATCLGPAVPSIRFVSVLEVTAMIAFFPITYLSNVYNFNWIWKYLLVAPVGVYRLYIEWEALKYLVPPYVYDGIRTTTDLWQVFGVSASFQLWRIVYAFFTVLSTADAFLDTGFASAIVFVMANDGGQTQAVYEEMWHRSILGYLGIPCPQIVWSVILMWLCTLVQPMANLIFTIPRGPVTYAVGDSGLQFYLFQRLNFEGVFFFLSAATGMSSIQSLEFRQGLHELARIQPEEMISYVQPMALGMFKRICYSWFLRNCIQLNVQTLIFGIHMHSGAVRTQTQTAVSIAVSIMMTLQKLTEIVTFERYVKTATEMWATDEELDRYIEENPKNHLFRGWKDGFWKLQWAIRFVVFLTVCSLALASLRLIMSTYVCESHLWEVFLGCAD